MGKPTNQTVNDAAFSSGPRRLAWSIHRKNGWGLFTTRFKQILRSTLSSDDKQLAQNPGIAVDQRLSIRRKDRQHRTGQTGNIRRLDWFRWLALARGGFQLENPQGQFGGVANVERLAVGSPAQGLLAFLQTGNRRRFPALEIAVATIERTDPIRSSRAASHRAAVRRNGAKHRGKPRRKDCLRQPSATAWI